VHVPHGPGVQCPEQCFGLPVGGEDDDHGIGAGALDLVDRVDAIAIWEVAVDNA